MSEENWYETDSGIKYGWWKRRSEEESFQKLIGAIQAEPEPPCKGCRNFAACGAELLACRDFATYTGIKSQKIRDLPDDRHAARFVYEAIFCETDEEV